ncbi:MAG: hypothetical protein L3K26_03625 [Candidatus Hydrogenedentes bacterium]|nr:hypothetical protein [Candidatus Hydrogenedentota bacterium]
MNNEKAREAVDGNDGVFASPATRVLTGYDTGTQGFARTSLHPGLSSVVHFVD